MVGEFCAVANSELAMGSWVQQKQRKEGCLPFAHGLFLFVCQINAKNALKKMEGWGALLPTCVLLKSI